MPRLPGDPSFARWLKFAIGFRLPYENREWVRHELTDAGWRGRTIRRLLVLMAPICMLILADRPHLTRALPAFGLKPNDAPALARHMFQYALAGLEAVARAARKEA